MDSNIFWKVFHSFRFFHFVFFALLTSPFSSRVFFFSAYLSFFLHFAFFPFPPLFFCIHLCSVPFSHWCTSFICHSVLPLYNVKVHALFHVVILCLSALPCALFLKQSWRGISLDVGEIEVCFTKYVLLIPTNLVRIVNYKYIKSTAWRVMLVLHFWWKAMIHTDWEYVCDI